MGAQVVLQQGQVLIGFNSIPNQIVKYKASQYRGQKMSLN
jgi:hypothetical protein